MSDKEGYEFVISSTEILLYRIPSCLSEIDDPKFPSFPTHSEFERFKIHITSIECREFRDTQSRRVDTLSDRIVTLSLDCLSDDSSEKPLDLFTREKCHFSISDLHEVEGCRIETVDLFLLQVFEPRPDRDDMSIHGLHGES